MPPPSLERVRGWPVEGVWGGFVVGGHVGVGAFDLEELSGGAEGEVADGHSEEVVVGAEAAVVFDGGGECAAGFEEGVCGVIERGIGRGSGGGHESSEACGRDEGESSRRLRVAKRR